MKIKDFKIGDTVYIIIPYGRPNDDCKIHTEKITKVGRLYVTVGETYQKEQYEVFDEYCLIEKKSWGNLKLLFKSKDDVDKFIKREKYKKWLFGNYCGASSHEYTYEQLKGVIAILNPNGEYDNEINGK